MEKRGQILSVFILLMLVSVIIPYVSAQGAASPPASYKGDWITAVLPESLAKFWNNNLLFTMSDVYEYIGFLGYFAKWFVLALIVACIFSAFSFIDLPHERPGIRFWISLLLGFFATVFISIPEISAAMMAYTAVGVALLIFLPFLVLFFFTFSTASRTSGLGILFQRVAWWIFGGFLLVKTGALFIVKYLASDVNFDIEKGHEILNFIVGKTNLEALKIADGSILIALFISSIVILVLASGNKMFTNWLEKNKMDAEIISREHQAMEAQAYDKIRAKEMSSGKKVK